MDYPIFNCCSFRKFDVGEKHVTRVYDQNVLIFMFSGILKFIEDGMSIELHPGEYYIQKKGLFQEGRYESDLPEYFFIHFSGDYKSIENTIPIRGKYNKTTFDSLFNSLNSPLSFEFKKQSIFFEILDKLSDIGSLIRSSAAFKIKAFIDTNYADDINTEVIANELSYSKQHSERLFKDSFGTTIHRYIIKKRIDEAKFMLTTSDKNIESIAYSCGYKDFSTFYRNFISLEGISPLKWKKQSI